MFHWSPVVGRVDTMGQTLLILEDTNRILMYSEMTLVHFKY
jgi:hypothetical protein